MNEYLKAKRRIFDTFTENCDPVAAAIGLSDEQMIALLEALEPFLPFRLPAQVRAVSMFLYSGCQRFDRWFPPSPYVVPHSQQERFRKFVEAFARVENPPMNSSVFRLHLLRDRLYVNFGENITSSIANENLTLLRQEILQIPVPASPTKRVEFEEQRTDLLAILDGLADQSLRTVLRFSVPYLLHTATLEIRFTWRRMPVKAQIIPSQKLLEETFVQTEGIVQTIGASRWQTGTSRITLELDALLDGSTFTPALQALQTDGPPVSGWPKSFTLAFSIFHDLAWRVRMEHAGTHNWIPAPRDLSDLEYWIKTLSHDNLGWMRKSSPAALMQFHAPEAQKLSLNLGELNQLPWATECTLRAHMYLELGDTNEALFWLNVAVESLIARRFVQIEQATGRLSLANDLGSPKEFWAEAEAIVSKQFPELAGKTKWPTAKIHVSIFGKLKALYRLVPMKTSLEELIVHYRAISGERNDLFHGKRSTRTTVAAVKAAKQSFDWIDSNMWPEAPHA
jgi:hypothetical protein